MQKSPSSGPPLQKTLMRRSVAAAATAATDRMPCGDLLFKSRLRHPIPNTMAWDTRSHCSLHPMRTLLDREIYERFTQKHLVNATRLVWIATANIKMAGVHYQGRFITIVDLMAALLNKGVSFRIIHSEIPSKPFRERYEQLDTKGRLSAGIEFLHCIRMHSKIYLVDGTVALVGSPNLTGAGIGAKSVVNRNFEVGFLFEGEEETRPFMDCFDFIWMGGHCPSCGRRDICPAPQT